MLGSIRTCRHGGLRSEMGTLDRSLLPMIRMSLPYSSRRGGRDGCLLLVALMAGGMLAGCRSEPPPPAAPSSSANSVQPPLPAPLRPPRFESSVVRVYTTIPGYAVFVDGLPVRTADGDISVTPCAVTASPGTHSVTIARSGERDESRTVRFETEEREEFFDVSGERSGESAALAAVLLDAPVGEPVPLAQVNSPGGESDPYLTPDGLSLWFAGDRTEGRGIYTATRSSPLDEFGPPQFLDMTRGADRPASPTVSLDSTGVTYLVPDKTRAWILTRAGPLAEFEERMPLYFTDAPGEQWLSGQLVGDGLRFYFVREATGQIETRVAIRTSLDKTFDQVLIVTLPGVHPCLSQDGLRQYAFDGERLMRSRRATVSAPFPQPEPIATLSLAGYHPSARHRQFWISDDEQWMVYCDDPEEGGDLYLVRILDRPGWGVALTGEPIEQKTMAAAEPAPTPRTRTPAETPAEPAGRTVDLRSIPLPYTEFRARLLESIAARDYEQAARLIEEARSDPALGPAAELLAWDAADVGELTLFWQDVLAAAGSLQEGDTFRDGSLKLEFVRWEEGALVGKTRTREITRPLKEMAGSSLVELVERQEGAEDAGRAWRATLFLAYDRQTSRSTRDRRLSEAGTRGSEWREQAALRLVRQAEWELERGASRRAMALIEDATESYAGTGAAEQAAALRDRLYSGFGWRPSGARQWETGPLGEFSAGPQRADESVLLSPAQYRRFELTMEYRLNAPNGQGGVFFRYPGSGALYGRCFKIQLSNDQGVNADEYCTGALFGIEAPTVNAAGRQGEWQTFKLRVEGEQTQVWINGQLVLDTTAIDDQIPETGSVALDGIVGGISYRKALITELP